MRLCYSQGLIAIFLILGSALSACSLGFARAVGESYTLTPSPSRSQEDSVAGVTLTLAVGNAATSTTYVFTWTVTDPAGNARTAVNSTFSTQTSWTLSVNYPRSFSGASLTLVGVYSVNVSQTSPTVSPNVGLGSFEIGLTDSPTYQRTFPMSIEASGYLPSESVTIDIRGPRTVPGYPLTKSSATDGHVSHSWQIPCDLATGIYTVTVVGSSTAKNPSDTQLVTVYPTNVTIAQLWTSRTSFQRTETVDVRFSATYLSGNPACAGSANLKLTEQDGVTFHQVQASYDSVLGVFLGTYRIPLNAQTGSWTATIDPGAFDDGYGNGGPVQSALGGFTVQAAGLSVSVTLSGGTYSVGELIAISASIYNPDGTGFTQGSVTATLSSAGRTINSPLGLFYDQARTLWVGSYTVSSDDPSGTWLVELNASDPYGNAGTSSATSLVSVPPPQPSITTTLGWLLPLIVIFGLGATVILLRYRQVTRNEVKLDVQAVKTQAEKVGQDDFLQSIQSQLRRRAERMAKEKREP